MSEFVIENGILKEYTGDPEHVVIPNSVTAIGQNAFMDCEQLSSVVLPDSLTYIGENAFKGCSLLNFRGKRSKPAGTR